MANSITVFSWKSLIWNRYVFSWLLNWAIVFASSNQRGSRFHSIGAKTENAWKLCDTVAYFGTFSKCYENEIEDQCRGPMWPSKSSDRYAGAMPFSGLYVSSKTLNTTLCFTGSQCRDTKTGLMWSNFFVSVTSLAAMFLKCCSFAIWVPYLGRPNRMLLQLSMWDVMKHMHKFFSNFLVQV